MWDELHIIPISGFRAQGLLMVVCVDLVGGNVAGVVFRGVGVNCGCCFFVWWVQVGQCELLD